MKRLFFTLLLAPALTFAQDCKIKKEIDPFSQQPKFTTGFLRLSDAEGGKINVNVEGDSKEIKFLFSSGPDHCFDDQSAAAITFDGTKTKSNQKNASSMNCEGIFSIVFRNGTSTPYFLQKMITQKITSIIITGTTKQKVEIVLKDEEKQQLLDMAACLVKESKTLVK